MYDIKNLNIWKKEEPSPHPSPDFLNSDISELNLTVRSANSLRRAGLHTVGDVVYLLARDENALRQIRNLGVHSEANILECLDNYRAQFADPPEATTVARSRRALIRPAKSVWNTNIEDFHLSQQTLARLRKCGIHRVRDLYASTSGIEPGWYAVRELFEKIP